ncbi:MAG: hypothetical protein V3S32_03405 [Acidimicrobiia bacterium]
MLSLVLFLAFANVVVVQYGRGAMRSALDQGARAGAISGSSADCEDRAGEVISQLLGGRMSDGMTINCGVSGNVMVARADGVFQTWTPLAPDFAVTVISEAALERQP